MKCPLCGCEFDPVALSCREAGCPLAKLQGCRMICCPNCGYQMPDQHSSALVGLLEQVQAGLARRKQHAIPDIPDGTMSIRRLNPGQSATVTELRFSDPDRLGQLCAYGLVPGSTIRLEQTQPVVILSIGGTMLSVDHEVADGILVSTD